MNIRRLIPLIYTIIAALFVATPVSANEIAAYARYQKAKTNKYDEVKTDFVVVYVGFSDDEAFDIYKNLPENSNETHIFVKDFFGTAKPKTVVVGHKGIRKADIATDYVEALNKVLKPTLSKTEVVPSFQIHPNGNCSGYI